MFINQNTVAKYIVPIKHDVNLFHLFCNNYLNIEQIFHRIFQFKINGVIMSVEHYNRFSIVIYRLVNKHTDLNYINMRKKRLMNITNIIITVIIDISTF